MAEETTSTNNPPSGGNSTKSKNTGLSKKVGPLPLWGWGAAAFAVGIAYFLLRKKNPPTANSSAGKATASPAFAAIPTSGGSGFYYNGTYPVSGTDGTTDTSGTGTNTNHPYAFVADIADLEQALDAGIPQDWLAYVGSDPNQAKASQDPTYAPPQGLPLASSLPAGAQTAYIGVANKVAPANAVKVYGATRKGTLAAMQKWYQDYQQYGQNVGYYIPQ